MTQTILHNGLINIYFMAGIQKPDSAPCSGNTGLSSKLIKALLNLQAVICTSATLNNNNNKIKKHNYEK
ncbi:MAG: hypothetical protein SFU87_06960 [Chitinophagaceae bacterium]|nr:hypothetical protein [Chitinophagaceae bacterium]